MKFTSAALVLIVGLALADAAIYSSDDYRKFTKDCGKILRSSAQTFQKLKDKNYGDDKEVHCLIRCIGVMTRFYDDETGPNWELVNQHLEGKPGLAEYREATQQCFAALDPTSYGEDYCKKSFLSYQCAMNAYETHVKGKETEA
ncbi:general odorant-binding protein 99b-like [Wyeomyia smithii]|uniref:general odorant-binding protein 99b-like n=1 Tax=Wyeomyia smithii TaxID=174621 RepID=UPI002467DA80|nr:general odorant-binding protein 99b-like [Wyeomyia smithii]